MYWDGKVVRVTGAASAIGRATALRLAAEQASLVLLDRDCEGLKGTVQMMQPPAQVLPLTVDLSDVATPMLGQWIEQHDHPSGLRSKIASPYLLGHYCEPSDVAGVIAFLMGPDSRCITGANIS